MSLLTQSLLRSNIALATLAARLSASALAPERREAISVPEPRPRTALAMGELCGRPSELFTAVRHGWALHNGCNGVARRKCDHDERLPRLVALA